MTTNHIEQIKAQIERFDRMRAEAGDRFEEDVLNEFVQLTHDHSFEAVLVDEPRIVANAIIGFNGDIECVRIPTGQGQLIHVEQDSGLWVAIEAWLTDMRDTWDGD